MTTLIAFLFALALLIFVHELGHYSVARWCGVKVLRFSIGFGKPLLMWRVGPDRTEWTISAIPLGGYVKMLDEREDVPGGVPAAELHRAFNRQSLGKRSAIVVAGPAANFLLAIALYMVLNMAGLQEPAAVLSAPPQGTPAAAAAVQAGDRVVSVDGRSVRSFTEMRMRLIEGVVDRRPIALGVEREGARITLPLDASVLAHDEIERDFTRALGLELASGAVVVSSVIADGSAAAAGLRAGDEVLRVDGRPVSRASELIDVVRANPQRELALAIRRGDVEQRVVVVPQPQQDAGATVGRIGAALQNRVQMVTIDLGPIEALGRGVRQTWDMSIFSLRMLGRMITGDVSWRNLSGPVTIADYAGQTAKVGWHAYVAFLALISVSLGVLNLLPVPVLDGGHLVYYALEAIRGKPLSERFLQITQRAGLAVVGSLMMIALFNDLSRLFGP